MEYCGLLNICKQPGLSSHEVVNVVRRVAGMKRIGHAGTLDPSACGVLLVCLGKAARLSDYMSAGCKSYRAEILFGITTDGGDAEGRILSQQDAAHLREETVYAALPHFTGTFQQRPPARSAVWIDGRRAYQLVLSGQTVEMPLREVSVAAFTPLRFVSGVHPRLLADITCSRGTFIRSLACDLGELLGVGATLSFLARTAVSGCTLEESVTLDELSAAAEAGEFTRHLHCPDIALGHIPPFTLSPDVAAYQRGTTVDVPGEPGLYRVYLEGIFLGLGRWEDGGLRNVVNIS